MKTRFFSLLLTIGLLISSCTSTQKGVSTVTESSIQATIDLVNVKNDKVKVSVKPGLINTGTITYQLPKIIPGTYAIADYGSFIDDFTAFDKTGNKLGVSRQDVNTWIISNATQLDKVTYWVNDSFDSEKGVAFSGDENTIFSPAGTNILAGKQFMLNMAGFLGYFEKQKDNPYVINITHPANLIGTSSMNDMDNNATTDLFKSARYADVVDSPIMYAAPDIGSFTVDGMKVILHVYSPQNKAITAQALLPDLQKMMVAQKKFLGNINKTPKYVVLVYVTANEKDDAHGIGALEHNYSTTAVFRNTMTSDDLIHVISHEFFHTLTPLNVHSKEIQYFDFNNPKMSAHLWMYEGFTEYFANLFQVNQGLMPEQEFLNIMAEKEQTANLNYPKLVSFTEMSKNILDPDMKKIYPNVYMKGALMAMCLDIIIRDKSNGKKGILNVMDELSKIYGPNKPFDDTELIPVFTKITYPEVGNFIQRYIVKGEPIDYADYLKLVGIKRVAVKTPPPIALILGTKPYFKVNPNENIVKIVANDSENEFIKAMGLQNGDILLEYNGIKIDPKDMSSVLGGVYKLQEGKPMTLKIKRNAKEMELRGIIKLNRIDSPGFKFEDESKKSLKESWLKG